MLLSCPISALVVCVALSGIALAQTVQQSRLEVVSDQASVGDGANNWGGHQTRIVRTKQGVFAAYTVEGHDELNREWRLAWRQNDGTWPVLASGPSGREPVNLLAGPDGTLYVVGWPGGKPTLWSGRLLNGKLALSSRALEGLPQGNWPYNSAGIDAQGNLCILASEGGSSEGGAFVWSCYKPKANQWVTFTSKLPYRYAYTYVFPNATGACLVSTRDVLWSALGLEKPPEAFDYAFNAFGYWCNSDSLKQLSYAEEKPSSAFPNVYLNAQMDAYQDTKGRMHILYWRKGPSTLGETQFWHRIVSPAGQTLYDNPMKGVEGWLNRIFQDYRGRFYLLSSSGQLFPMDSNGFELSKPIQLDLEGYSVDYSGFGISVPRTGTQPSRFMEVVFPAENSHKWVYFRLEFP